MTTDEILRKIIRKYGVETENIRTMQIIESKLAKHTVTYRDANQYAQEIGRILTDIFREYLPDALTDGKLYRAAAEVLMKGPMVQAGHDVGRIAQMIQQDLNGQAGIGLNAVVPDLNEDQIDGIITGVCNAESFAGTEELLMDQVSNFLEGHVDDFVHDNAEFQSNSGLTVTVQRISTGKCCPWCSNLAGNYLYDQVADHSNDVWRRHNNCHCQIIYDPRGSKRMVYNGRVSPRRGG